jgi:hypothetical protein
VRPSLECPGHRQTHLELAAARRGTKSILEGARLTCIVDPSHALPSLRGVAGDGLLLPCTVALPRVSPMNPVLVRRSELLGSQSIFLISDVGRYQVLVPMQAVHRPYLESHFANSKLPNHAQPLTRDRLCSIIRRLPPILAKDIRTPLRRKFLKATASRLGTEKTCDNTALGSFNNQSM